MLYHATFLKAFLADPVKTHPRTSLQGHQLKPSRAGEKNTQEKGC